MHKSSTKEAQHDEKPRITTLFLVLQLQHDETRLWNTVQVRDKRVKKTRIELPTAMYAFMWQDRGLNKAGNRFLGEGKRWLTGRAQNIWTEFFGRGPKRSSEELSDKGRRAPLFLPNPPLGSSFSFFFFFFRAYLVVRPFSLTRSLAPGYPLKFPLCTSVILH